MVAVNVSVNVAGGGLQSIESLKAAAAKDPKAAIRETAKQFEQLFMQQLMKSMRDSTMASGMFDNEGTKLGNEMLDSQYAAKMSGLPGGLTDAIARQLERQMGVDAPAAAASSPSAKRFQPIKTSGASAVDATPLSQRQVDFVRGHANAARAAEAQSGIPAAFMIGQAAHETGWGRAAIRNADGSDSHNLFGVKAGAGWAGATADITTTEYVNGEAQKVTAKFRAYASYDEAFRDYARMLVQSPRYAEVAAQAAAAPASPASAAGFAQGLQRAGYATDPAYASKLTNVINSAIRVARLG